MATEKQSQTSRENGKKGGRPVSDATIRAQLGRDYISKQLQDSLAPIVAKAITLAMEGDYHARDWLSDRAWGKPQQNIDLSSGGNEIELSDEERARIDVLFT